MCHNELISLVPRHAAKIAAAAAPVNFGWRGGAPNFFPAAGAVWLRRRNSAAEGSRGHSRSLKMVSIESLGTVSYLPSIVTMAVSLAILEIFSIKEWLDLEIWIWGHSRSFKMARFDRPHTTFYWSSIVTIVLSCTIFELFDVD